MTVFLRHFAVLAASVLLAACAGDYNPAVAKKPAGITQASGPLADKLEQLVGVRPDSIAPSAAPGLLEAKWGSNFAYVTPDGEFAVFGDMVNVRTSEQVTENARRGARVLALQELGSDNTIEFSPESPKHVVTVFTDIDCGYCRMLHRQVPEYNAMGIGIRYVFYPRSGRGTESFQKAQAVWCASDRKAALTQAKATGEFQGPSDCVNPVQRQWELGQGFGLRGTPMIVLPDGENVAGYLPPQELQARLDQMGAAQQLGRR